MYHIVSIKSSQHCKLHACSVPRKHTGISAVVYTALYDEVPSSNINVIAISRLMTDAFPNVRVKTVGNKSVKFLIGLKLRQQPLAFLPDTAVISFPRTSGSPSEPIQMMNRQTAERSHDNLQFSACMVCKGEGRQVYNMHT